MLEPDALTEVATFVARKQGQWARIANAVATGVQLVQSGEKGTQFMMTVHDGDFYEGIVYGQLPHIVRKQVGPKHSPTYVNVPNAQKPYEAQRIDLTDAQLDAIVQRWATGTSAIDLPFVTRVWTSSGEWLVKA